MALIFGPLPSPFWPECALWWVRSGEFNGLAKPVSIPHELPTAPRFGVGPVAIACGFLGVAVLLATLALWSHYGTAVFFDMIATGFAACF